MGALKAFHHKVAISALMLHYFTLERLEAAGSQWLLGNNFVNCINCLIYRPKMLKHLFVSSFSNVGICRWKLNML